MVEVGAQKLDQLQQAQGLGKPLVLSIKRRIVRSSESSPGGPSLVTNADDLTGLHDPKGLENLRHERTQLFHMVVRAIAMTTAMPLARKFC
jgi:hypothetical protein